MCSMGLKSSDDFDVIRKNVLSKILRKFLQISEEFSPHNNHENIARKIFNISVGFIVCSR